MTEHTTDPERIRLITRYVLPDLRHYKIGGGLLVRDPASRTRVLTSLAEDAATITDAELTALLDSGGWRERKVATWFLGATGRQDFRPRLGELLLASEGPSVGQTYCVVLTHFGTPADADFLVRYLEVYLRRPDLYYDQSAALGALLEFDRRHDTAHARPFLADGGLWRQWIAGPPEKSRLDAPESHRDFMARMCGLLAETAGLVRERRPGRPS
ncbi:hypothetical protein JOF53_007463 [Crossiella equi]|uniref:Uncharacterized protein n=1 Tax=Crossiella equi TaxID=130796 RepID=A0ABS5APU5_9PSEU|nr:DUF6000 family protein [Crossiella equi]MBP2478591.1 hypothetical protein [Crossiella equi]